jgi:hypothetical protein
MFSINYAELTVTDKLYVDYLINMSSSTPPGPDSTSTSRPLRCEPCGITFSTTEELAQHNRKEHG